MVDKKNGNLVAYCGLYCAECFGYKGSIADLARDLRKELRKSRYEKFAKFISTFSFGKDFNTMKSATKSLG